jgi:NAD(P)-dependent dehydrogenase (short-subunit alcohol dehydrogenase family)
MLLQNKRALVTGGTSGIGKAIVEHFWREGAQIVFTGRREELGHNIVDNLGGKRIGYVKCDLRNPGDIDRLVQEALALLGAIDILVNNAGVLLLGDLEDISYDDFLEVYRVNVFAPFLLMKKILPLMREKRGGVVINISSIAGISPYPRGGVYCSSKAALISLTRVAALEYAGYGVRVVSIAPGLVDTPMLYMNIDQKERDKYREMMKKRVPLGRIASPDEVAELAVYLASDKARQITGSVHVIDGGTIAGRQTSALVEKKEDT